MNISEWTANRLKVLCKEKNITINKLATLSGITQSTLNSIIKGESKNPRLSTIKKICIGLNISINDFFDESFDELDID
ncbi:transcriptional regulator [Vallitalea longa]|uniref:Transcriptional regulator n=1 Tax=Vallitalea longa TaxID=2936439 RepID=A0A9W5YD57_9FIRM|nr:transcriptional regulator [Vallitalea longa]